MRWSKDNSVRINDTDFQTNPEMDKTEAERLRWTKSKVQTQEGCPSEPSRKNSGRESTDNTDAHERPHLHLGDLRGSHTRGFTGTASPGTRAQAGELHAQPAGGPGLFEPEDSLSCPGAARLRFQSTTQARRPAAPAPAAQRAWSRSRAFRTRAGSARRGVSAHGPGTASGLRAPSTGSGAATHKEYETQRCNHTLTVQPSATLFAEAAPRHAHAVTPLPESAGLASRNPESRRAARAVLRAPARAVRASGWWGRCVGRAGRRPGRLSTRLSAPWPTLGWWLCGGTRRGLQAAARRGAAAAAASGPEVSWVEASGGRAGQSAGPPQRGTRRWAPPGRTEVTPPFAVRRCPANPVCGAVFQPPLCHLHPLLCLYLDAGREGPESPRARTWFGNARRPTSPRGPRVAPYRRIREVQLDFSREGRSHLSDSEGRGSPHLFRRNAFLVVSVFSGFWYGMVGESTRFVRPFP